MVLPHGKRKGRGKGRGKGKVAPAHAIKGCKVSGELILEIGT